MMHNRNIVIHISKGEDIRYMLVQLAIRIVSPECTLNLHSSSITDIILNKMQTNLGHTDLVKSVQDKKVQLPTTTIRYNCQKKNYQYV